MTESPLPLASIKNTIILFVCPSEAEALFLFSLRTYNGPKRNWKQFLCNILQGQTKSIKVFLIVAN